MRAWRRWPTLVQWVRVAAPSLLRRTARWPIALLAAGTGLLIASAVIIAGHPRGHTFSAVTETVPPLAQPPLLRSLPSPTKVIVLATGHSGSFTWKLKAKVNPSPNIPGPGSGNYGFYSSRADLCFGVSLAFSGSVYCTSPFSGDPSLVWTSDGPPSTTDAKSLPRSKALVYGVTSARAAWITVTFAGTSRAVTVATVRTPAIPGLRFFGAVVPSGHQTTVEAVAADGKPIERGRTGVAGGNSPGSRSFHR